MIERDSPAMGFGRHYAHGILRRDERVVQLAGPAPVDAALVLPWLGQLVERGDEDVRVQAAANSPPDMASAGWSPI
jgi:hypothetical protein